MGERAKLELLLALETAALSALAFSRPILDGFGGSPLPFISRGVTTASQVVWFALVVVLVPILMATLVGLAGSVAGQPVRRGLHIGLVALLGGIAAWWLGFQNTALADSAVLLVLAAGAAGAVLGWLRWWRRTEAGTAAFLRFAGIAPVVLLLQFLFMSSAGSWALRSDRLDRATMDQVAAQLGEDPPPIVMLVFDALPTATLLDGAGQIDAELFPSFAGLADDATWYRNHTTVSLFTGDSLPVIATGRLLGETDWPGLGGQNLLALLARPYDLHAEEQATAMCPDDLCHTSSRDFSGGVGALLGDAQRFWSETMRRERLGVDQFDLGGTLGGDRLAGAMALVDQVEANAPRGGSPPMHFYHLLLPHGPWIFTDDGTPYEPVDRVPLGTTFLHWSGAGTEVGRQRHVLQTQATDRLLGMFLAKLQDEGIYDDALIVVTADHGEAFLPNDSARGLSAENQHHVAWVPLLIKEPGQSEGVIDDDNMMTIDIVPTIADLLGVDIPWDVDGLPARQVPRGRDPGIKVVLDHELNVLRPDDGETVVYIDAEAGFERLMGESATDDSGPYAVWQRTEYGELLAQPVDDFDVGEPAEARGAEATLDISAPASLEGIVTSEPLPLEVVGETDLEPGTVVAYALNGEIAAVTEVEEANPNRAHALLLPAPFVDGNNDLSAYLVEGPPGDPTLHALDAHMQR